MWLAWFLEALVDHREPLVGEHRSRGDLHRYRGERVRRFRVRSGADDKRDVEAMRVDPQGRVVPVAGLGRARQEEVVDRAAKRLGCSIGRLERDAEGQEAAVA